MNIRFAPVPTMQPLLGRPNYVIQDYALDFEVAEKEELERRIGSGGTTSLVGDTEQLEISIKFSLCLYIWGYSPYTKWKCKSLSEPVSQICGLRAIPDHPFKPGVSESVGEYLSHQVSFDMISGWLCIGDKSLINGDDAIEFSQKTIAVLNNGYLKALWVQPANWPELTKLIKKKTNNTFSPRSQPLQ